MAKSVVFVHDGPLTYDEKGHYYGYGYRGCYERYRHFGDKVSFVIRTRKSSKTDVYDRLPDELRVVSFPDFKSPELFVSNYGEAKRIILGEAKKADFLVLRVSLAASIAERYARKHGIPYLYECVGCSWDSMWNHSVLGKVLAPVSYLSQRASIRRAPYVHYVTTDFLQRRYPTKGKSVGCSDVRIGAPTSTIINRRLERIADLSNKSTVILGTAAAVDVRYKGQETVLRAMPLLASKGINVVYRLAGGNYRNSTFLYDLAVRLGVDNKIEFLGALSKEQMPVFYDSLDVYVQPSRQEGLPRSVVEAMSRACPVIGSDAGGIPELISSEQVFRKGSQRCFARSLTALLTGDIAKVAVNNYYEAKKYSEAVLSEEIASFYRMVMDECEMVDTIPHKTTHCNL